MNSPPPDRDYLALGSTWVLGFLVGAVCGILLTCSYYIAGTPQ